MKITILKFLITIISIPLFWWVSKLCYVPEIHAPIVLMWVAIALVLLHMWKDKLHWPVGKYNRLRIDGFEIKFQLHLLWWRWKPVIYLRHGTPYVIWLCFSLRGELSYKTQ